MIDQELIILIERQVPIFEYQEQRYYLADDDWQKHMLQNMPQVNETPYYEGWHAPKPILRDADESDITDSWIKKWIANNPDDWREEDE